MKGTIYKLDRRYKEYIAYNENDEFIDLGTSKELAERFGIRPVDVRQKCADLKRHKGKYRLNTGIKFYLLDNE